MKRGHDMMNRLLAVLALAFATVMPLTADTWTDPDTDYTWTYRINSDSVEIYNGVGSAAISPSPTGAVTIPSMLAGRPVTCIGKYAFYNCSGLTSIHINAIALPEIANLNSSPMSVFDNTNNCPIYVPAVSMDAYKADDNWGIYSDRINAFGN